MEGLIVYFHLYQTVCSIQTRLQFTHISEEAKIILKLRSLKIMASRGANILVSRASRIKQKIQSALEESILEVEDIFYHHAGHAAVKENPNNETHFNVMIISPKFDGQSLVKRHSRVYELLGENLTMDCMHSLLWPRLQKRLKRILSKSYSGASNIPRIEGDEV